MPSNNPISTIKTGKHYEVLVSKKLKNLHYRLLTTNFHSKYGEIDIIAIHKHTLVFLEVKARTSSSFGQPFEAVTKQKLEKIIKTGDYFREKYRHKKLPDATRIDVVSVLVDKKNHEIKDFQLMKNVTR